MDMARQSIPKAVPVLLTRPEAEAHAFASALIARFDRKLLTVIAPLMAPRFLSPPVPSDRFVGVVFSSASGVEGARRLGVNLPSLAYCVGRKTAATAKAAGFQARSADGNADALVAAILAERPMGKLLYIHGVDSRGEVAERLNTEGVTTVSLQAYIQVSHPLSVEAIALLRQSGDVILPLFSPRSAVLFLEAKPTETQASLHIAAMSTAVAEALGDLPCSAIAVARKPDAEGMLDAVGSLLEDLCPT